MELVSVIIPVYKVEKYLRECLDSVICQTYADLQIILVDDGSPDSCGEICDEYAHIDNRITVLHCENGGLSAARNRGLKIAQGEYIYFVDSDDYLEKNAIEVLYRYTKAEELDILLYDAISFDETNVNIQSSEINKYIRKNAYPTTCTGAQLFTELLKNDEYRSPVQYYFYKKSFLDENNLRFHEGILHEDEEFNFFSLLYAKRVKHIPNVLYHHRFRADSIMGAKSTKKNTDSCFEIIKTFLKNSEKFLQNPQVCKAFKTGLARMIEVYYSRVRASVDGKSPKTKAQIRKLRHLLRQIHYYNDEEVKKAALDIRNKRFTVKKLKMRLYPVLHKLKLK